MSIGGTMPYPGLVGVEDGTQRVVQGWILQPLNGFTISIKMIRERNKLEDCGLYIRFKTTLATPGLATQGGTRFECGYFFVQREEYLLYLAD